MVIQSTKHLWPFPGDSLSSGQRRNKRQKRGSSFLNDIFGPSISSTTLRLSFFPLFRRGLFLGKGRFRPLLFIFWDILPTDIPVTCDYLTNVRLVRLERKSERASIEPWADKEHYLL